MQDRRRLIAFGLIGAAASALAVVADLFVARTAAFWIAFDSLWTGFFEGISPERSGELTDLLWSHYLAAVGVPGGLFGLRVLYRVIRPADRTLAYWLFGVGIVGFAAGFLFHLSLSFLGVALRTSAAAPDQVAARFAPFMHPFAYLFVGAVVAASLLYAVRVALGGTLLPRRAWLLNPVTFLIALDLIVLAMPDPVAVPMLVTVYNASLALTFLGVVWLLRRGYADRGDG